jgi:hypothetical protein
LIANERSKSSGLAVLDGSPDLHPHVRPDVVETAERFGGVRDE